MTSLALSIEQQVTIVSDGKSLRETFVLAETHEHGARANQAEPAERYIRLDLKKIKFEVPSSRRKKDVLKPYRELDLQVMRNVQPTSHGQLVQNEYFLTIRTVF